MAAAGPLPTFTGSSATFAVGQASASAILAGPASAKVTEKGKLPAGISLKTSPAGTVLSGTPHANTGGVYQVTLTASNGGANASEAYTVTVNQALAITSSAKTTFTAGLLDTFAVNATGYPFAEWSLANVPAAIAGVVGLVDNGNGTATLTALPPPGVTGTFMFSIVAANSLGTTTERFTLTIDDAPIITSPTTATLTVNQSMTPFTITTSATPTATLRYAGKLPPGIAFKVGANGTATLTGRPTRAGTYTIVVTASNGAAPAALQLLTLVIQ